MAGRHGRKQSDRKLTAKERAKAIWHVAQLTYKAAPMAVIVKVIGSVITAVLPLVTTYFAALTTTELAKAYAGDSGAGEQAILFVLITAILGVFMTGWKSFEQYINELTRYRVEAAMNDRMYEHFLSLDFWRYDDKTTADRFDKAKRFANFFAYVFDRLAGLVTQFITMIAGLGALVLVSWWLGLILIIAVVPSVVIQFRLSRKQIAHWNSNVETRRAKNMIEWQLFEPKHIAELRLYGMARHLLDLRMRLRDSDEKERIEFERQFILKRFGADTLEAAAEVIALVYTTMQIIAHAQPIGQLLYVQQVVSRALSGSSGFVSQLNTLDEDLANLFDYQEFMELPLYTSNGVKLFEAPDTIEVKHVSFHYPQSDKKVLQDVSLSIKKGQHVAIVGENGAGKSTLIKILTGLYRPNEGSVVLNGKDLNEYDVASWHAQLGVLQQEYLAYIFANAEDNIYFGDVSTPLDTKRLNAAIDRAEARTFLEKLPKGLETFLSAWMEHNDGTNGVDLSGGQWQRLALARNFYRDSPVIILDEPTSAIDALAESRIFKHLFDDKTRTVIAISHRLTTIERSDVIFMLQEGRVVERGTHEELVAKRGAYYHMFESQLRK
ncbi:MAG TPA: ABC transporter ATP-binding protein [Candidatus Saccharimonadales bacterium]|nr:ABC transporter ATP-binding protein [Candidatus Saccharimonadales bacterium]